MSNISEFPGFGRILERSEPCELELAVADVQAAAKLLNSPTAHSQGSMSTGRNLTARCLSEDETHASPGRVSPDEAQLICRSVLFELLAEPPAETTVQQSACLDEAPKESAVQQVKSLSKAESVAVAMCNNIKPKGRHVQTLAMEEPAFGVDLAKVKVSKCDRGCIMGDLDWCGPASTGASEKVVFSLLQMRPGYTVVGECLEGPKLLSSVCWKLQSVNGRLDANIASLRPGDVLMLEGPRWATKRLIEQAPASCSSSSTSSPSKRLQAPETGDALDEIAALADTSSKLLASKSNEALDDLAALADASSMLLAASEMCDGPPLLRATAMPRIAFPAFSQRTPVESNPFSAFSQRTPVESGRAFLKDSMRTPKEGFLMHSMRTPKDSEGSFAKDSRRSWEIGSDLNSAIRPHVPTLDFTAISELRKQRLQQNWIPVTPKDDFPAMTPSLSSHPSQRTNNVCIDPSGCNLGLVECKMVTPGGFQSKAKPPGYY